MSDMLFYLFASAAIVAALAAVTSRRILRAAVYLMFVLINTAALYALLGAYFLAGLQLLVYVGGIVVLIVFAVMLTYQGTEPEEPAISRRLIAGTGVGLLFGFTQYAIRQELLSGYAAGNDAVAISRSIASADPAALGRILLDYGPGGYALPFEVISLILLAAIIGGIVIARKSQRTVVEETGKGSSRLGEM